MGVFICLSILYISPALIGLIPFIFFNQAIFIKVDDEDSSLYIVTCFMPIMNLMIYIWVMLLLTDTIVNKIDNLRLSINNTGNKSKINYKKENHES